MMGVWESRVPVLTSSHTSHRSLNLSSLPLRASASPHEQDLWAPMAVGEIQLQSSSSQVLGREDLAGLGIESQLGMRGEAEIWDIEAEVGGGEWLSLDPCVGQAGLWVSGSPCSLDSHCRHKASELPCNAHRSRSNKTPFKMSSAELQIPTNKSL